MLGEPVAKLLGSGEGDDGLFGHLWDFHSVDGHRDVPNWENQLMYDKNVLRAA